MSSMSVLASGEGREIRSAVSQQSHRRLSRKDIENPEHQEDGSGEVTVNITAASAGMKLEDQLTNEKLKKLEQTFEEADEDGGGGLDMDEFRNAMRKTLGGHLTDEELDMIFMKVDTNCDATVDWDEYLSYMLLEYREKDQMNFLAMEKPFPQEAKSIDEVAYHHRHHDSIVKIMFLPTVKKVNNALYQVPEDGENNGRYMTVSKDGVVNFWSLEMNHMKRFQLDSRSRHRVWVTATAIMPNIHMIAVATTSCTISFYDLQSQSNSFNLNLVLRDLEIAATTMHYWYDSKKLDTAMLFWGDFRGNIYILQIRGCPQVCALHPKMNKKKNSLPLSKIQHGSVCGLSLTKIPRAHEDLVIEVQYIPELEVFMSCCRERKTSLLMSDIAFKRPSYFRQPKGIFTFDFSDAHNFIVTGGKDSIVRVWNPYITARPVILLQGHKHGVIYVRIDEKKEHVISISESKDILIYDLSTQICIQAIYKKFVNIGPRPLSAVFYNADRMALLLATNRMVVIQHKEQELHSVQLCSHKAPVNCVLYNKLFHQVVSGGVDSMVMVWDVATGEKLMQFAAHCDYYHGQEINNAITSMSFDTTQRRLVTAATNGSIKIWNFNNGACLRVIEEGSTANIEVTGVVWPLNRVISCGWTQKLVCYLDAGDDETVSYWDRSHQEDILALAYNDSLTVASASYDGDIMIWSLDTSKPVMKFNASQSARAQLCGKVKHEEEAVSNFDRNELSEDDSNNNMASFDGSSLSYSVITQSEVSSSDTSRTGDKRVGAYVPSGQGCNTSIQEILEHEKCNARARKLPHKHCKTGAEQGKLKIPFSRLPRNARITHVTMRRLMSTKVTFGARYTRHHPESRQEKFSGMSQHGPDMTEVQEQQERYVNVLLFLTSRKNDKDIATLVSAGYHGWVYFWSVHHKGGLQGMFNAAHYMDHDVTALATDPKNTLLITGDAGGYIKIWHITHYCNKENKVDSFMLQLELFTKFPFLKIEPSVRSSIKSQKRHERPPETTNPQVTHKAPLLLSSVKTHLQTVTSIQYISDGELVLSCSTDCSIRLHTITGQFIGVYGHTNTWKNCPYRGGGRDLSLNHAHMTVKRHGVVGAAIMSKHLPPDIRRVASSTSLNVLYGGMSPLVSLVKHIIMVIVPMLMKSRKYLDRSDLMLVEMKDSKVGEPTQNYRPSLGVDFKVHRKHQPLPPIRKPRMFADQCAVYSSLPCYNLEHVSTELTPPPTIKEIQERNQAMTRIKQPRKRSDTTPVKRRFSAVPRRLSYAVKAINKFSSKKQRESGMQAMESHGKKFPGLGIPLPSIMDTK